MSYTVLVVCVENFLHLLPEAFLPFEDCPRKRQSSVDFASNMCGEKVMHWKYKILHAVHGKHAGSELLLCHHIWHDICLACSASYGTTLQIRTRNASRNCRAVDLHSRSLLIYTSIEDGMALVMFMKAVMKKLNICHLPRLPQDSVGRRCGPSLPRCPRGYHTPPEHGSDSSKDIHHHYQLLTR